jgi:hypothetical protein
MLFKRDVQDRVDMYGQRISFLMVKETQNEAVLSLQP